MRNEFARYARRLESLSITELSQGAEKLVSSERRYTAALIAHLAEISRRKGHLELGYKSLFDYCRIHLGLGKGSVWSRTQLANVSRRFPQVLEYLVAGKVSLSSLGVLAAHLSEENVDGLLAQAEGKTKEEVKEIVAAICPKPAAKPTIRRKLVRSREESPERRSDSAESVQPPERPVSRGESESRKPAGSIEAARPDVYNIRFSAGKSLKQKLERFAEVLGIDCAARCMPEIFEKALDLALEKMDPKQKLERRKKREAARSKTRPDEASPLKSRLEEAAGAKKREARAGSRYLPSSVREHLLERAGYQCEFRGPGGVRCTARTRLEVDHIDPVGKGGSRGEENLRVFCRGHNLLCAEREFGEEFMRGKIEGRKSKQSKRCRGRGWAVVVEPA